MRLGIEKLDSVLGEVREGDVLLIETVGSLGVEILSKLIRDNKEKLAVVVVLPKGASERRIIPTEGVDLLVMGENVHAERLYEILHTIRKLPGGSLIVGIRLDNLLLFRPPEAVYRFMEDIVSTVQNKNLIFVTTIDKRNVSERDLAVFENLSTHIIDITETVKGFKVSLVMRVKKSPNGSSGFCEFEIHEGRVVIGSSPDNL